MDRKHIAQEAGLETESGFLSFYEGAFLLVYGYFFRRVGGNRLIAEELTQETFLASLRAIRQGTVVRHPMPWVITIARRRLVDHYRSDGRRSSLEPVVDSVVVGTEWSDPNEAMVAEALHQLQRNYAVALTLRYVDDLTVTQVAGEMGKSVRATESLLVRARASLARAVKEIENDY